MVRAIRRAAAGETTFAVEPVRAARGSLRTPSEREVQRLGLLAAGGSNGEIALKLGISVRTVESHLRRLFARYGVLSRTELAIFAVLEGWIPVRVDRPGRQS